MTNPYLITGPALISFSGGRTSGYMLKHILDAHGGTLPDDVKVAFANTGKEMPETLDFVQECSDRWGVHIAWLEYDPASDHKTKVVSHNSASRNGEPFAAVIASRQMLPNPVMRFCTIEMKIRRFREYCVHHLGWHHWTSVIGLRADEPRRIAKQHARNAQGKDLWRTAVPLGAAGVTKRDVQAWWKEQPFDLRLDNINGSAPEGNCDLCFLKAEATIRGIIRKRPGVADWWAAQEEWGQERRKDFDNPDMLRFRADRPSYAQLIEQADKQGDFFDDEGESVDCACTD